MFRNLITLDEAKKKIEGFHLKPVGTEKIPLLEAVGRVSAEEVTSPIDVPPFHRSTVDGYAVKAEDTFNAEEDKPVPLKLKGHTQVGEISSFGAMEGSSVEIVTGAPLPKNTDAVVMMENTSQKNGKIFTYKPVAKNENVMLLGSDIQKGQIILRRGDTLTSRKLGMLAAAGLDIATVFKRPRIAVISTGTEIIEPGKALPPGKIYDINAYTLAAAILENGGEPVRFGIVQEDDAELLKTTLKRALDTSDVVITSGGVSVGPKDFIPAVLKKLGKPGLVVHGIAIKPGKPVAIALIDDKPVFSLPGHPTSSLLMFHLIVRSALRRMLGKKEKAVETLKAVVTKKLFSARGRRTFITVSLCRDASGKWLACQIPTGQSGAITTLAMADGYVELKETQQFIEAGKEVTVSLFKNA